jgi:hypothetical protein
MMKIILASLIILLLQNSTQAADRIRIGVPEFNAQFLPLALAEKRKRILELAGEQRQVSGRVT